MIEQYVEIC